jgi:LmbE family N-acetylglucosaminyl deacetylase
MKQPFHGRHLMGLFPHPDDESYGSGGTFALCAKGGARTTIVCATRGEAGVDLTQDALEGSALAERRSEELRQACKRLGTDAPVFLNLPDAGVAQVAEAEVAERIEQLLSQERPDVVVTLGWDGVYGHTDHIAITRSLAKVIDACPPARRPRFLLVAFPKGLFTPVRHLMQKHAPELLANAEEEQEPGIERAKVDLIMDIRAVADVKRQALAAHLSQYRHGDPSTFLYPGLIDKLMCEEYFIVANGTLLPHGAQDPFSGLP